MLHGKKRREGQKKLTLAVFVATSAATVSDAVASTSAFAITITLLPLLRSPSPISSLPFLPLTLPYSVFFFFYPFHRLLEWQESRLEDSLVSPFMPFEQVLKNRTQDSTQPSLMGWDVAKSSRFPKKCPKT